MVRKLNPRFNKNDQDIEDESVTLQFDDMVSDEGETVAEVLAAELSVEQDGDKNAEKAKKLKKGKKFQAENAQTQESVDDQAKEDEVKASATGKPAPSIEELRARLAQKIQTLRAQRKAPGTGVAGAPTNRESILEARKLKAQKKKEKEALKRKRSEEEEQQQQAHSTLADAKSNGIANENTNGEDVSMFSKIALESGEEVLTSGEIQQKKRKKGPSDLLGQLKHVEAKKARIAKMDKEKREDVEQKEKWKRAIKQAEGEKVKDDEKLIRKSLTRQVKQKKKSAREWQERKENVLKGIHARQKKREENIAARKEMKKKGNKAGKKSASKPKRRPGFESGNKRKKK
ncbi:surfeit locus protein 6-domain-containing protein [Lipomyces japonicus]|uniref:surfeit locus protein 6-domain-containing protein n=1 Tax=Lipomyces japonicus TaxID=56871 RepID=UPI0034CDAA3C